MKILVLNSGSSSQKTALFESEGPASHDAPAPLWEGKLEWDGTKQSLSIKTCNGQKLHTQGEVGSRGRTASVEDMIQNLWAGPTAILSGPAEVQAVGHR